MSVSDSTSDENWVEPEEAIIPFSEENETKQSPNVHIRENSITKSMTKSFTNSKNDNNITPKSLKIDNNPNIIDNQSNINQNKLINNNNNNNNNEINENNDELPKELINAFRRISTNMDTITEEKISKINENESKNDLYNRKNSLGLDIDNLPVDIHETHFLSMSMSSNNESKNGDNKKSQNRISAFFAKNFFVKAPPKKGSIISNNNDDDLDQTEKEYLKKVKVKGTTRVGELKDLRLGQYIKDAHQGAIYCMEFSKKGDYLATAGQDSILKIWTICGSTCDSIRWDPNVKPSKLNNSKSQKNNKNNINNNNNNKKVFEDPPNANDIINPICYREFTGHRAPIIDISWSNGEFILTASIDQTVMLWHTCRTRCLCLFQHSDIVTSVQFHPIQDYLFISGSFDSRLRLWNILEHRVVDWVQVPTLVTSSTFSPNGKYVVAGLYDGQCFFYTTEGLRLSYVTAIEARNANGKYKKGTKVTGLHYRPINNNNSSDNINDNNTKNNDNNKNNHNNNNKNKKIFKNRLKLREMEHGSSELLISTNDSRIRLCNVSNFDMKCKYKGHTNTQSQIDARFSPDGNLIISGSENGNIYIWRYKRHINDENSAYMKLKKNRNEYYECFKPKKIKKLLNNNHINNNNTNTNIVDNNDNINQSSNNPQSSSNLSTKDDQNTKNDTSSGHSIQQCALFSRHRTIHYTTKFRKQYNKLIHINEEPIIDKNNEKQNERKLTNFQDKIKHIIVTADTDGNIMVFTNHSNDKNYNYPHNTNINAYSRSYMKAKKKKKTNQKSDTKLF